jgi:hypothetical protein
MRLGRRDWKSWKVEDEAVYLFLLGMQLAEWRTLIKEACLESELALVHCRNCCSVRRPRRQWVDLDRRGHAGGQANTIRYLIDPDADRHALSKTYPSEDWVDGRKPLRVGLHVRDINAARDAVDVASYDLTIAHQLDRGRIAIVDRVKLGLLKIGVDPEESALTMEMTLCPTDP